MYKCISICTKHTVWQGNWYNIRNRENCVAYFLNALYTYKYFIQILFEVNMYSAYEDGGFLDQKIEKNKEKYKGEPIYPHFFQILLYETFFNVTKNYLCTEKTKFEF